MVIDYVTGMLAACLCRSGKTEGGGLSSAVGWAGLAKKIGTLLLVLVAHGLDIVGDDCKDVICLVEGIIHSSTRITNKSDSTWEWGNYIRVDDATGNRLFFCHLASLLCKECAGANVR